MGATALNRCPAEKTVQFTLFHYWRSSSSWRVRWALAHKGVNYRTIPVDLLSGESESPEHLERNPMGFVPVLRIESELDSGLEPLLLCESLAMIELLEELFPKPTLYPGDAFRRAQIRQLAEIINAGTQPLQNLGPQFLHSTDAEERKRWAQHWIRNGLQAYEKLVSKTSGHFSVGDEITTADLCLIPQCYNARRYDIAVEDYPTIARIEALALQSDACRASHPDRFTPPARS